MMIDTIEYIDRETSVESKAVMNTYRQRSVDKFEEHAVESNNHKCG